MVGVGTIVNVVTIIIGSIVGLLAGSRLPQRIHNLLIRAAGLTTIGIGIKMFLETRQVIIVLSSLVVGGVIGEMINIEALLEAFGERVKKISRSNSKTFLDGFVSTSLLYCVGPMAILGSIADGLNGEYQILFTKAVLDGVVSIAFAAALGIGVMFSSLTVLIYQGALTVVAILFGNLLIPEMTIELTATGGILILGIGLNLLGVFQDGRKIPIGNLLPAIVVAPVVVWLLRYFGIS